MSGFGQYLKDTRGELRHVAWPTQTQTIVYTVLVALISVGVALYLGLFDFIFTSGLARTLEILPSAEPVTVTQEPFSTSTSGASSSAASSSEAPAFDIPGVGGTSGQ
ncbi:preprotein translocase subunit SecE [Candidatus Kaiserbacteria bacterium]|nr:preprotein translocase subunit SecE [Candidatus Kaiserbacteria bacterium]